MFTSPQPELLRRVASNRRPPSKAMAGLKKKGESLSAGEDENAAAEGTAERPGRSVSTCAWRGRREQVERALPREGRQGLDKSAELMARNPEISSARDGREWR